MSKLTAARSNRLAGQEKQKRRGRALIFLVSSPFSDVKSSGSWPDWYCFFFLKDNIFIAFGFTWHFHPRGIRKRLGARWRHVMRGKSSLEADRTCKIQRNRHTHSHTHLFDFPSCDLYCYHVQPFFYKVRYVWWWKRSTTGTKNPSFVLIFLSQQIRSHIFWTVSFNSLNSAVWKNLTVFDLRALRMYACMCLVCPFNPYRKGDCPVYLLHPAPQRTCSQHNEDIEWSALGIHKSSRWIRGGFVQTVWTSLWSNHIWPKHWHTNTHPLALTHILPAHSHLTPALTMISFEV